MNKKYLIIVFVLLISGCANQVKEFYNPISPESYSKTESVKFYNYRNVDISSVYDGVFNNYKIIGISRFDNDSFNKEITEEFAKEIGADVVIYSKNKAGISQYSIPVTIPTTQMTTINIYSQNNIYTGTASTIGSSTIFRPVFVQNYGFEFMFLKNINNIKQIWELNREQIDKYSNLKASQRWSFREFYFDIYESGNELIGFWGDHDAFGGKAGKFKFIFNNDDKSGLFILDGQTPTPSSYVINNFGEIEVHFPGEKDWLSFKVEKINQ